MGYPRRAGPSVGSAARALAARRDVHPSGQAARGAVPPAEPATPRVALARLGLRGAMNALHVPAGGAEIHGAHCAGGLEPPAIAERLDVLVPDLGPPAVAAPVAPLAVAVAAVPGTVGQVELARVDVIPSVPHVRTSGTEVAERGTEVLGRQLLPVQVDGGDRSHGPDALERQ